MRKLWEANKKLLILSIVLVVLWGTYFFIIEALGRLFVEGRPTFMGPIPRTNFDGIHYLVIAERGYGLHQEPFFPLFPLLIRFLAPIFAGNYLVSALTIIHISLVITLVFLWRLVAFDFGKETSRWSLAFFLLFPTAFFLGSIYTESFFLMLIFGSFYAARKGKWWISGILGALASATRMVGIFLLPALIFEFYKQNFKGKIRRDEYSTKLKRGVGILLIPLGLLSYMVFLNNLTGDPFAFIHSQPAFGANRSGSEIILLPQVIFRYVKIFLTVPSSNYDFWIAVLEFFSFAIVIGSLLIFWKKIRMSYLIFSLLAIIAPTLTGTLSSMPRYVITAFPVFIMLGSLENKLVRFLLLSVSLILLTVLTVLFTQGYFVA